MMQTRLVKCRAADVGFTESIKVFKTNHLFFIPPTEALNILGRQSSNWSPRPIK